MGAKLNKKGFSTVEVLLVVLVILILGLGGWLVYKNNHKTKKTTTSSSSSMSNMNMNSGQYTGWKTMTLKYEKITFMYPSNWKLVDNSISSPQNLGGCTYPGHDYIILTSPNNNQVNLQTGIDCIGDANAKSFGSIPVKSLGENLFLDFEADSFEVNPTGPSFACLAPSTTADSWLSFNSKNIFPSNGNPSAPMNSFCFTPFTGSDFQSAPNLTVEQIESNVDFNDAKLIFESMTY